ncbi:MAG TPA: patatin-like phospholipase family protein [Azospirillaceae bacterium]|nr:patatin-like phospholipase family protein [Azospirillaceae bacterium]
MSNALSNPPLIGLALGGGAARGWAHIGAIKALHRLGIKPDVIAGTSIGAVVGGVAIAGKLEALETWATALNRRRIVGFLDFKFRSGGIVGGNRLIAELKTHLGNKTIEDLGTPFATVATDLVSGHEVWMSRGPLVESIRASMSLPGVFPPCKCNGRWLVDGALVNPVPISVCRALGARMVIAVNLNADVLGKVRKPGTSIPTAAGFDLLPVDGEEDVPEPMSPIEGLARRVFRREPDQPSIFGTMVGSMGIVMDRITRSRLAGDPPDVHISPRIGHIGLLEFDRAAELIDEGEAAVERALPELRDALSVFGIRTGP